MSNKRPNRATVQEWGAFLGAIAAIAGLIWNVYNNFAPSKPPTPATSPQPSPAAPNPSASSSSNPPAPSPSLSGSDEALLRRGIARMQSQNYPGAIEIFDQIIQNNPTFSKAYLLRAVIYSQFNRCQKAIESYTQALQVNTEWIRMSEEESTLLSLGNQPT